MKTTQAAGIVLEIGGHYHYDCAICDRSRTPITDTVKSLSIEAYRFFILQYCTLIFLSSYVFGNYRNPNTLCPIISPHKILL